MRKIVFVLVVILICSSLILGACAKQTPAPSPSPAPSPAPAPPPEPIELTAISFLPQVQKDLFALFEFIEVVNERAKGELIINYLGGPEVIPMFEQAEAISDGVADMGINSCSFMRDTMPECFAVYLSEYSPMEERERGWADWLNKWHNEKMNLEYLCNASYKQAYDWFTNKKITRPQELAGQKTGTTGPVFQALALAFDTIPVNLSVPEHYTAIERGVIDGYMWPLTAAVDMGTSEVTEYLIRPSFYDHCDSHLMMNLDSYNSLPPHLKELLKDVGSNVIEPQIEPFIKQLRADYLEIMIDGGMELIEFSAEDAAWFVDTAYKAGWEDFKTIVSPEAYDKVREMIADKY